MPSDNGSMRTNNKKKVIALIIAAVLLALALVLLLIVPSCNGQNGAGPVTGELPQLRTVELERPESGPLSQGDVHVVNAEELYVRIVDAALPEVYATNPADLTVKVSVGTRESGDRVWIKTYAGDALKQSGAWDAGGSEVGIVLDSLRDGQSLGDQVGDGNLKLATVVRPGADMLVYAAVLYGDGGIDNGEGEEVNSLYQGLEYKDGTTVAVVSTLRHLANLDTKRSDSQAYSSVRLDADIDFEGGQWAEPTSVSPVARQNGQAVRPIAYLTPLLLVRNAQSTASVIDGADHVLRNFVIGNPGAAADNTGLFSTLSCEVSHLTIANPHVTGKVRTGALAGDLKEGAKVHDCTIAVEPRADGTYAYDDYKVTGTTSVGGLVGRATSASIDSCLSCVSVSGESKVGGLVGEVARGSIAQSGVRAAFVGETGDTPAPQVTGNLVVGGLVGTASGVTPIERSYAAVDVYSPVDDQPQQPVSAQPQRPAATPSANAQEQRRTATARFGGFAGIVENACEVRNCYATGTVRAQSEVGGFVGRSANKSNIRSCFATGDVRGDMMAAGFVGDVAGGGVIENSLSYGLVTNIAGTPIAENGGFFGYNDATSANNIGDTNAFLREGGYNDVVAADANKGDGKSYGRGKPVSSLMVDDGAITHVDKVHGYRADLKGQAFPFADTTGLDEIWGNWPVMRLASWYHDNGELIVQRQVPTSVEPAFDSPLRAAERPQDYYGDQGPYYLFVGWDAGYTETGEYVATAQVMELPFHEFFPDDPQAGWVRDVRARLVELVDEDWKALEDFTIDSQAPDSPSNPEAFAYQITAKAGQEPVFTMGQKLPAPGQPAGYYRVLRYDIGANTLQVGYATAKDSTKGDVHYFAYGDFTADPVE